MRIAGLKSRAHLIVVTAEHGADRGEPSTTASRRAVEPTAAPPDQLEFA